MQLSDDLFDGIRKTLGLTDAQSWDSRRGRRASRLSASVSVKIVPYGMAGTRPRTVSLADLSKRGISFVDDRTWAAGDKLVVYLPRSAQHLIPFVCEARNAMVSGTQFRIGAEFIDDADLGGNLLLRGVDGVSESAAQQFIPMTQAGRKAKRQWFGEAARAQLHTYRKDNPGPILEAEVADLSDAGVGLICAGELLVGQTIMVRLCPPGGKTMTRMCRVANCRVLDNGTYRVGATFVKSPGPASGLQVLLGWFREKN
jgi:hypothetical protein